MESKMSWDVYIGIDTGLKDAKIIDVRNVTYNNGRIFVRLGVHPEDMKGKTCAEIVPMIKKALKDSYDENIEKELQELSPENNWGGIADSRDFLNKLLAACEEHPLAKVIWS